MEKMAYNQGETAKMLGVCKGTVIKLIKEGKLHAQTPSPRRVIIPLESIKEYLNDRS